MASDALSGEDYEPLTPRGESSVPPWQCPGPSASEVVSLPFNLAAVLEHHCEAKQPNSCVDLCDECLAARRRVAS